jgi:hypothetical protein
MNTFIQQLIATFHHIVHEQFGNDITIARAKTMLALTSLTWPSIGIVVIPHEIAPGRMVWKSAAFDSMVMGGSFRRDPIGDHALIIFDEDKPEKLVMFDEMRECALFIPLFGKQRLERFNITLAGLVSSRESGTPLPLSGNEQSQAFPYVEEYRRLHEWLVDHGTITLDGQWIRDIKDNAVNKRDISDVSAPVLNAELEQ